MEYHKIQTVFKRDPETKHKTLLEGDYSIPEFEYLKDNQWDFTEKIDGTNIRICFDFETKVLDFKGKTDRAQLPAQLVNHLRESILVEELVEMFPDSNAVLYGEGCGAKIQKGGGNYYNDQRFVLFDVLIGKWWLKRDAVQDIAKELNLPIAPLFSDGTLNDMVELARKGFNSEWGDFQAEGIVARPKSELIARNGKRIITKIKCKDFR